MATLRLASIADPELIHGVLQCESHLSDQPYPDFVTFNTYAPAFPSPSPSTGTDLSLRQSHQWHGRFSFLLRRPSYSIYAMRRGCTPWHGILSIFMLWSLRPKTILAPCCQSRLYNLSKVKMSHCLTTLRLLRERMLNDPQMMLADSTCPGSPTFQDMKIGKCSCKFNVSIVTIDDRLQLAYSVGHYGR